MAAPVVPQAKIKKLEKDLLEWIELKDEVVKQLRELACNLDEHFSRITKAKIGGSAASIGGGILAAVGFGLSFVTFGASLGLTIAGGIIAGAGGATVGGSMVTDAVLSKKRKNSADELIEKYNAKFKSIKKECLEIGEILEKHSVGCVEKSFPKWVDFWAVLAIGAAGAAKGTTWDIIAKTILTSLRIASAADDAAAAGVRAGATAFRVAGVAGRAFHVAGGVVGVLMIPLDVYTLVKSSIDEHKKNPHQVSESIRKMADMMDEDCPSKSKIKTIIDELNQSH